MTEKRYYEKDYDELYYIFDSKTLSEKEFEKKVEYDGYDVFADSLTSKEVVDVFVCKTVRTHKNVTYTIEIIRFNKEV